MPCFLFISCELLRPASMKNFDLDRHNGHISSLKDLTKAVIVRIMDFIRKLDLVLR